MSELCREHGTSAAMFYKWRAKYGGMDAWLMAQLQELEDENWRLKNMYAEEGPPKIIFKNLEPRCLAEFLKRAKF